MKPNLIIGTGRCGTGFIAELLSNAGRDTTHEHYWHPEYGAGGFGTPREPSLIARDMRNDGNDGEASWLALPWVESWGHDTVRRHFELFTLIRHPQKTVQSLYSIGLFHEGPDDHDPYRNFIKRYGPWDASAHPIERAAMFWLEWNSRCVKATAGKVIRLEELASPMETEHHCKMLGLDLERGRQAILSTHPANSRRKVAIPWNVWCESSPCREITRCTRLLGYQPF